MAKQETFSDGLHNISFRGGQKLVSTPEGLEKIASDRAMVRRAIKLFDLADQQNRENAIVSDNGVTVTAKGHLGSEKWNDSEAFYYKLDAPAGTMFVKRIPAHLQYDTGGGVTEMYDTREAKELLKEVPGVEIVDYILGYEDNKNKYFVSRWNPEFESTLAYLEDIQEKEQELTDKEKSLLERIKKIQSVLGNRFWDTNPHNMSYNPSTNTIYIFDINKAQNPL